MIYELKVEPKPLEYIPLNTKLPKELKEVMVILKPGVSMPLSELTELVDFAVALANAIAKFTLGGANIISGAFAFIPVVPKAVKAVIGLDKIPAEVKYMTPKQKQELVDSIQAQLMFTDTVKKTVGWALDIVFAIKSLISTLKG